MNEQISFDRNVVFWVGCIMSIRNNVRKLNDQSYFLWVTGESGNEKGR